MIQIGGSCGGSNVELHDIRFCLGNQIEDCYDDLREQWWGNPKGLHLDCWGEIRQVDGHNVNIVPKNRSNHINKLFFLNLGGYTTTQFGELHENLLLVMPDLSSAKKRALAEVKHWAQPHQDKGFEVENSINLSKSVQSNGYSIELTPSEKQVPFEFICKYKKIG
ncbi:DUF1543 domain-containing protein [Brucella sp. C7-11G]